MEILSFFGGVLYCYTQSLLALSCLLLLIIFRPQWRIIGACGLGYLFGIAHQWWVQDQGMPPQAVIRHALVTGVVASIPKQNADRVQFEFDMRTLNDHPVSARVQLGCYRDCPMIHAGQLWRLRVKLHRAHNLNNPGSFDYKAYLAAKHIHWVGYATKGGMERLPNPVLRWDVMVLREKLAAHLAKLLSDPTTLGIAQALTIGVTTHISQAAWALFRCTGTTHLMVISGAHIGLVAGMIFHVISKLWAWFPWLCLRYPAQKVAAAMAIFSSIGYALIAGLGAPAERATIAAGLVFLRYIRQQQFGAWQAWRYALLVVVLTEPHAVVLPGFYLSFIAVAILLTMNQRILAKKWIKALLIQVACMVGLLPLTLFWFSYGAVNGLLANLLAIPWVSFVIVPLSFISLGFGKFLPALPLALHYCIQYLLQFLHWVDGLAGVNVQMAYSHVGLAISAMLGLGVYWFLPLRPLVPVMLTLIMAACYPMRPQICDQEFQAKILDVGQGLAVLIQTQQHTLLYDTGGQNYHGSDMGNMVILPYFQQIGLRHLDKIVISHPDLDHRGGLLSLQQAFPQAELIVDNPQFYHQGYACHRYPDWIWEGVRFHFFPLNTQAATTNNRSCILQISNASGQLLLVGDIEKSAEKTLVSLYGHHLHSSVLVVPHHGSKTSSSLEFLHYTAPQYAIFSYGFDNRYHFPHAQILQRYKNLHIRTFATAEQGLIHVWFKRRRLEIWPMLTKS